MKYFPFRIKIPFSASVFVFAFFFLINTYK